MLHALLNVPDEDTPFHQPWVGASCEGCVIEQILAALQQADRLLEAYHCRTSDQREIDLLVASESGRWAVEAKPTTNPRRSDLGRLNANADLVGAQRRFLVCHQSDFIEGQSATICDLGGFLGYIRKRGKTAP